MSDKTGGNSSEAVWIEQQQAMWEEKRFADTAPCPDCSQAEKRKKQRNGRSEDKKQ